ncbi:lactate dehydrogenase [Pandoraea pneumonica]|uniref:Lactate dehydrogenase n=1 Tax=Pandoraea pneumonica TaxID=2508299 RepID=A0A5E4S6Z8_9BURK|nr:hypothetical protein [Pandoraea pneumonica]VVD69998.1 lactate dehydrogenase [Pandoraea pneumonica]
MTSLTNLTSLNTLNVLSSGITSANNSAVTSRAAAASAVPTATQNDNASVPESTRVTLSPAPVVANWPTYSQPTLNGGTLTWQHALSDPLSLLMSGNVSTSALGNRLEHLGSGLLTAIANGSASYNQTVLRSGLTGPATGTELAVQQAQLQTHADNQFALTITTASGAKVNISLGSSDDGLAASFSVAKGTLTDAERNAIGQLADAFQNAITGLAKQPPTVDFSELTGFDTSVLTSVDLNATLGANKSTAPQTFAFHADATVRSLSASGPTGTFDVSVDLSDLQVIGSKQAQADALDAWLTRFDSAQTRGNGDASLMTMFKSAFTALNSHYPPAPSMPRIALSGADRTALSGLADFSASISQANSTPNPMRPSEVDGFNYRISQQTAIGGKDWLNRTISQQTRADLSASYHRSLWPGVPLNLTTDPKSQNYEYVTVQDSAQSTTNIGYRDGLLANAQVSRSASQSMNVKRYELAKLVSDVTTPASASHVSNLMTLLQSAMQQEIGKSASDNAKATTDNAARQAVQSRTALEIDPANIS